MLVLVQCLEAHDHRLDFVFRQLIFLKQPSTLRLPVRLVVRHHSLFALKFVHELD